MTRVAVSNKLAFLYVYVTASMTEQWPTASMAASYAGGLEFKSRTGQIFTALQTVRHPFDIYADSCVSLAL